MNIEPHNRASRIGGNPTSFVGKLQVMNQKANASRVLDAKQQYALNIKNITQSLFGYEFADLTQVIARILIMCDFEAMCTFRLVAKGFYDLSFNAIDYDDAPMNQIGPFLKKAAISFKYADIVDADVIDLVANKIKFINILSPEVNFTATLDEIDNLLINQLFREKQSTITLKISTTTALNELCALSSQPSFSHIAPKLKRLDLSKINITEDNCLSIHGLLTTVFQKCKCLKTLSIGDVNILEKNPFFQLPDFCDSLTELFIGTIHFKMVMLLPKSCNNLKSVSIKNIYPKSLASLASESNNLLNCTIGNIWKDILLILPKSITSLFIKEINQDVVFELPESVECPNLLKLSIEKIGSNAKLNLEKSLNNLTSCLILKDIANNICFNLSKSLTNLFIKTIWKDDRIKLAALNIKSLIINEIQGNVVLELPNSLLELTIDKIQANVALELKASLTRLNIGTIFLNAVLLSLPNTVKSLSLGESSSINRINVNSISSLPNELLDFSIGIVNSKDPITLPISLKSLFIGQINFGITLNLSNLPPNFTHLTIGKMPAKSGLKLPNLCNEDLTLTINDIHNEVNFKLPDRLASLNIGEINNNTTLKLPSSLRNLKSLSIGHIGHKAIIELPNSMHQLNELSVENNTTLQLFSKFASLTKIVIRNLHGQFKLPPCWNLKSFSIGCVKTNNDENNIVCDLNSLSSLTNLSIEYIEYGANFELLGTYRNLQTLTLGTISGNSTLKLKSLGKLEKLTIGNLGRDVSFDGSSLFAHLKMLTINGHNAEIKIENDVKKFIFAPGTLRVKQFVVSCPLDNTIRSLGLFEDIK